MRQFLLLSLSLVTLIGCTTIGDIEPDRDDLTYELDFAGVEQERLHEEARRYIARSFTSAQDVIQYENAEEGEIIGNGRTSYDGGWGTGISAHELRFSMNVRSREGRVQIRFENLEGYGTNGWIEQEYRTFTETQYENAQNTFEDLVDSFHESVTRELEDDF